MTYDLRERRDTPLALKLKARIREHGPLSIADYMSECLWDEAHGYYTTKTVIGRAGDFITSAEISQIFGELIGVWAGVVWQTVLQSPPAIQIVEYGPGRGTLMYDCLRASRVVPGFHDAIAVHLVEMSHTLKTAQQQTLQKAGVPVTWGHNLAGFATPAIIIANEFLDSWPVEQWVKTERGWCARAVGIGENGHLCFTTLDTGRVRDDLPTRHRAAPIGAIVEGARADLLADALRSLAETGPVATLIVDYGHTSEASGDTLQAVRNHSYESPLASPGEADISAQVNFFDLAVALHAAGLEIDGPVTQTEFLGCLGIVERASRLMSANPERAAEIEAGVARIIAPSGMGSRFKVIGVRSRGLPPLPGLSNV